MRVYDINNDESNYDWEEVVIMTNTEYSVMRNETLNSWEHPIFSARKLIDLGCHSPREKVQIEEVLSRI